MNKIPKLNFNYWILMLLCTTMGELIGNLISRNFELGYTNGALIDVFVFTATISLFLTFKLRNSIFYWILILIGNIGGTNLADWVTLDPLEKDKHWGILKPLQLGTKMGSLCVVLTLLAILIVRFLISKNHKDGVLSKVFYWFAILLSSTFGTTSGDLITNDTPLGALWGSVFLIILLILTYIAYRNGKLNSAIAYWLSLVLMHPVGATIGNYISKPIGFNWGNVYTNIVMILVFAIIYFYNNKLLKKDQYLMS